MNFNPEDYARQAFGSVGGQNPIMTGSWKSFRMDGALAPRPASGPAIKAPAGAGLDFLKIESASATYGGITLPLAGAYQVGNTAIAIAAPDELAAPSGLELPEQVVKSGLTSVRWPGRFHVLAQESAPGGGRRAQYARRRRLGSIAS